jgi:DNA repair exonuclease SbcCD ATPase subunit
MNAGADVTDVEVLRDWLASLTTYRSEVQEAMSTFRAELQRAQAWVVEQLQLWQRAVRKRDDAVVQAKAELAQKRFPDFSGRMPDTTVEERTLRRAQAALEEAEERVRACRHWTVQLPRLIDEQYHGVAGQLSQFLDADVPRGAAMLEQRIESLEMYLGLRSQTLPSDGGQG